MGNTIFSPCFQLKTLNSVVSPVRLVFWEGTTRFLSGTRHVAGEIMFDFPDKMVCHGESFFLGHPVPALSIDDELSPGETYFVLPIDARALSSSSLAALGDKKSPIKFGGKPFEYVKGESGRVAIKVSPEFIVKLICRGNSSDKNSGDGSVSPTGGYLCSTPELQKDYDRLVGTREQVWSPKLETISECKVRFSPCRFIKVGVQKESYCDF